MKTPKKLINKYKNEKITLTRAELDKLKLNSTRHALEVVMCIPLLALKDEFDFDQDKLMRFWNRFENINEAYNDGYIKLEDIRDTLTKEANINFN